MVNKVSIVIPTYNRADYLENCIISCLNQTQECEIIVCDHGSTDRTPEMIKSVFQNQVKYIRRELDSGVHFCWLDGILHASEDLIHINFDDDWIAPTFIEKCSALFTEEVGCVYSDAVIVDEKSKNHHTSIFRITDKTGIYSSRIIEELNLNSLSSPCAGIFRKSILIDNLFVGNIPFTSKSYHGVGPDILFPLMSSFKYPKFGFVAEDLAFFRAHENSITIDALKSTEKSKKIADAYSEARNYYKFQKGYAKLNPYLKKGIKKIINYYAR